MANNSITRQRIQRLFVAFVAFWLPVIVFSKLAGEVIEREPLSGDVAILSWIHSFAAPSLDAFFLTITNFGGIVGVGIIVSIVSLYLIYKKQKTHLFLLLASVGGAAVANVVLKLLFQRDRPSFWDQYIVETGFSFPSGHAMATAALGLALIVILWNTRFRWVAVAMSALYVVLIGLSRMYLGVHYPSDILAGWSVSVAWVALVTYFVVRYHRKKSAVQTHTNIDI